MMEWSDGGEWRSEGESEREGGVRERGGVKEGRGVREREGSEVDSWFVGAHRPCARMGQGAPWSWACLGHGRAWVVGVHGSWSCLGCGHAWVVGRPWSSARISWGCISVVGGIVVGRGRSSCMGGCRLIICGGTTLYTPPPVLVDSWFIPGPFLSPGGVLVHS